MTSLGVASSNGTAIGAPNMPSEITEEIVKEVIVVEADTELQEPSWRFLKQENEELKKRLKEMEEELEEKDSDLEQREDLISALLVKERYSNDEIQEARKLLISELRDLMDDGSKIRVKRMGDLDVEPFVKASKRRLTGEDTKLYTKWEENLRDPHWQPFKRVEIGNKVKEVVDEEDEKLKNLREKWGEEVTNAVKTALEEVNEFNPSGRHAVPALWNSEQGRTATLREAIAHMTREIKTLKRKTKLKHRKYL
ncbi:putative domain XH [Arabidopsis suecica]|uniref:Putative domain XH n=1 Tax=Arabidopsis suecica TaxID=45249 RepID=A0A8T1ZT67_ARASU|nr:putative domain XH [Arabidopsis suecica]